VKLDLSLYDKIFENRVRLQIMSVLAANEEYDFNSLKELLDVTDGNLASNLKTLEKEEYIVVEKSFVDRFLSNNFEKQSTFKIILYERNPIEVHVASLRLVLQNLCNSL